jgi:hypothetical protein
MIRDPSGFLERIPELQALCEHPRVRQAVEGGDPFKLYRALVWARLFGGLHRHREVLAQLLKNRRLFARPLKGTPWLGTLNGFGATFLGESERGDDGISVATHYIVALFAVPLFPLGAYLVQRGEGGGLTGGSWHIFARVPLSTMNWIWSRGLGLAALALVSLGAVSAFESSRHQTVHLVNGFAQPLKVTLADKQVTVPANGRI